jgi:hypothetical protein
MHQIKNHEHKRKLLMKIDCRFLWALTLLLAMGVTAGPVLAGDIEKGTVSLGASSNLGIATTDVDDERSNSFSLSTAVGYFVFRNLELGVGLSYRYGTGEDDYTHSSYMVIPYLTYYITLSEQSSFYLSAGYGFGMSRSDHEDYSWKSETTVYFGDLGWQYYFTDNVALNFGVRADRYHENDNGDSIYRCSNCDDERDFTVVGSYLRLKLYF